MKKEQTLMICQNSTHCTALNGYYTPVY